ncbi:MAG: ChaN family lipoprotein [Candidatus Aminicenantaceae bacterium]
MSLRKIYAVFLILFFPVFGFNQENDDKTLRLKIGNPLYKDKTLFIKAGKIYSAKKGKPVSFERMIKEMEDARFVYVGETHDSLPMHDIQHKIARALYKTDRDLSIGMEMFDVQWQEELNKWSHGILTQDEFIDQIKWYETWNFHFDYYRKIFELSKERKIPLYALNAPREIIRKIRMKGWGSLTDKEKSIVPKPDLSNQDHIHLMKTIFSGMDIPNAMKGRNEMMFQGLYRAQSAWDEVMAYNTRKAASIEDSRMIVFAGSGHLIYNLGINYRVHKKQPLPYKTVICVVIPDEEKSLEVSRSLGDFIWGLPFEQKPAYPSFGMALKKVEGLDNPVLARDPVRGIAKGKNFKKGDIILSVDGKTFASINNLRKHLHGFTWGDEVVFRLLRQGNEVESKLKISLDK